MSATVPQEKSLSQRELRNESGRVLREISEGRAFVVTNRGIPVARIIPLDAPTPALQIVRPALTSLHPVRWVSFDAAG